MIFLLSVYILIGLIWYFVTLMAYGFGAAFGGSKESIKNWTFKTFYEWIYPEKGFTYKHIIGIPIWTFCWPLSLSSSLIGAYLSK